MHRVQFTPSTSILQVQYPAYRFCSMRGVGTTSQYQMYIPRSSHLFGARVYYNTSVIIHVPPAHHFCLMRGSGTTPQYHMYVDSPFDRIHIYHSSGMWLTTHICKIRLCRDRRLVGHGMAFNLYSLHPSCGYNTPCITPVQCVGLVQPLNTICIIPAHHFCLVHGIATTLITIHLITSIQCTGLLQYLTHISWTSYTPISYTKLTSQPPQINTCKSVDFEKGILYNMTCSQTTGVKAIS